MMVKIIRRSKIVAKYKKYTLLIGLRGFPLSRQIASLSLIASSWVTERLKTHKSHSFTQCRRRRLTFFTNQKKNLYQKFTSIFDFFEWTNRKKISKFRKLIFEWTNRKKKHSNNRWIAFFITSSLRSSI